MDALKSQFYQTFPSKSAPVHGSVCDGYFEDVQMYVGLGFSRSQLEHLKLVKKENGILSWDGAILD